MKLLNVIFGVHKYRWVLTSGMLMFKNQLSKLKKKKSPIVGFVGPTVVDFWLSM